MITLCTSSLDRQQPFLDILIKSVLKTSELISEVVVNNPDRESDWDHENTEREIKFKYIGRGNANIKGVGAGYAGCCQHGNGLTNAVEHASNDLVLLNDPDIFFYSPVEVLFHDLMKKYGLNIVGISHPAAITEAFQYYPNVMCTLVNKKDLCDSNFLLGDTWLNDYIADISTIPFLSLMPGEVKGKKYPKQDGHFETGCNLPVLGEQNGWKWLSFQTGDGNKYNTQYYRGNLKVDKIIRQKLLYHQVNSAGLQHGGIVPFTREWETWLRSEDDN